MNDDERFQHSGYSDAFLRLLMACKLTVDDDIRRKIGVDAPTLEPLYPKPKFVRWYIEGEE